MSHATASGSVYKNTNGMPLTNEGKNLHMDTGPGDMANRIITVGSVGRAELIAKYLDAEPAPKVITSNRGFTTITGYFRGVHVSVVAIGMGPSMMDFFVRETRAVVEGPMAIIRFGTCGGLTDSAQAGTIVVASQGSGYIVRNPDAFQHNYCGSTSTSTTSSSCGGVAGSSPYLYFKVAPANDSLSKSVISSLSAAVGAAHVREGTNVTAESFYSSQGRIDESFDDLNASIVDAIKEHYPTGETLEMESFQLLHLAQCCVRPGGSIKAAAAAIVVANRPTGNVIDGQVLLSMEANGGRAMLEAICNVDL